MRLLNDILDFSKISRSIELEQIDFDLRECIGKAMKLPVLKASDKGIELGTGLTLDSESTRRVIQVDSRQIIVNFVGNAIKFTDVGRGRYR
ncbi:MAG: hypothetical protein WKF73_14010 [Nocardioidaceae bacterium]